MLLISVVIVVDSAVKFSVVELTIIVVVLVSVAEVDAWLVDSVDEKGASIEDCVVLSISVS